MDGEDGEGKAENEVEGDEEGVKPADRLIGDKVNIHHYRA